MEQCVIPIELFDIICGNDWRVWRGLIGACRALYYALKWRHDEVFKRSLVGSIVDKSSIYKFNKYVHWTAPNGVVWRKMEIYIHEDYVNVLYLRHRICGDDGVIWWEISRYIQNRLCMIEYKNDNKFIYRWRYGGTYTICTSLGAEFTDTRKSVALNALKVHKTHSFMINYLPDDNQ